VSIMLTRTRAVDWVWVRNRMKHALRGMAEQVCRVYNMHAHPARGLSHLASQNGMYPVPLRYMPFCEARAGVECRRDTGT
jgi:hypothetical protein